jgi:glucose/mannose transport system substrate-binding protein
MIWRTVKCLFVVLLLSLFSFNAFAGDVEVLHWWTSGGEAAALAVLKQMLEQEGHTWQDFAVAGGGGDAAMTVLKSRAVSGNPPTAAQVKGPQIQLWGDEGVLANLDDVARAEKWDTLIPKVVADIMKYKGNYVAVPVNVHRINWMWVNPAVFKQAGAAIPKTWAEFETAAKKIEAAGFIPVAWGGQPWQEATVFETIVAGIGGSEFYRQSLVQAKPEALNSPTMIKVLDTLRMITKYIDPGAPGRDWNLATAMVIKGEAAMQFMGDWAKGEFTAAGKKPNVDYIAARAPQTEKQFIFNIDSFIMFDVSDTGAQAAQKAMARLILTPKFQEVFNINKGSIPVRMGMPETPFDIPARLSMKDFLASAKTGDLIPSMAHEMAVMPAIRGAIMDVVTNFVNSSMTAKVAAAQLAKAVQAAK